MGKYLLLEFESDDQADALISKIVRAHEAGQKDGRRFRVAGIFQRPPRKRCECTFVSDQERRRSRRSHYKTGFSYCTKCKRVAPGYQGPLNQLIDPERTKDVRFNWIRDSGEPYIRLDSSDGRPLANFPLEVPEGGDLPWRWPDHLRP